jgi:hypothetical protein
VAVSNISKHGEERKRNDSPARAAWIDRARAVPIEAEATRRRLRLKGRVDRTGPCPRCGGHDRFSINLKKQVWNCRGCQCGGDVIDLVCFLDNLDFKQAVELLAGGEADPRRHPSPPPRRRVRSPPDNSESAGRIWQQAVDPRGTLVETYLNGRSLDLPDEAALEAIRFHADCPFGQERFPAMVCLVRDIISNEPQAIHRTALAPDGTAIKRNGKTFRLSLAPVAGGAIKLDADEDVTHGLCIGEGVETCLAGRQMGYRPVWSAVNSGGVASFPVLPGIDDLHIFKEIDLNGTSERDVETCARRWYYEGRDVFIVEPEVGKDLNAEIMAEAAP